MPIRLLLALILTFTTAHVRAEVHEAVPAQAPAVASPSDLITEIQGTWRMERSAGGWNEKVVEGNLESLTRYTADGKVEESHTVQFALSRKDDGAKHYKIVKMEFTEGPQKGLVVPADVLQQLPGYLYEVTDDTFVEHSPQRDGKTRKHLWKRVE